MVKYKLSIIIILALLIAGCNPGKERKGNPTHHPNPGVAHGHLSSPK